MKTVDAQGLAALFIYNIFHLHGPPDSIVSDCGPQFAADFWRLLCASLRIATRLSTAFTLGLMDRPGGLMHLWRNTSGRMSITFRMNGYSTYH